MKQGPADLPFSHELLDLYQSFHEAPIEERPALVLKIAATFAAERDPSDTESSEEYHDLVEAYERAQLKYEQHAQRVTRLAVQLIESFFKNEGLEVDDVLEEQASVLQNQN